MVSLSRDPRTGSWKSRKVIPEDVRRAYGKANETPTWPASLSNAQAKAAYSSWLAEVEGKIERLRKIATAAPIRLTHREVQEMAAKWYLSRVREHEDDPGAALGWQMTRDQLEYEDEEAADEAYQRGLAYDGPVKRIAWVEADARDLMEREGVVLDDQSSRTLIDRLHELLPALCDLMERRAAGDYGPDPVASTLPLAKVSEAAASAPGTTLMALFEKYVAERQPAAAATQKAWRRQLGHLKGFLGHDDVARISPQDIVAWKENLLAGRTRSGEPRSAKTVRDTYLAVVKTVLGYGVENRILATNAAAGITVRAPKQVRLRDRGLTDAEALIILEGTLRPSKGTPSPERALAQRWVPWLCAYTGARVNEMTQLRREDVFKTDDVWMVRITPEAGSVKTNTARDVPLHSHLIDQGFVEAVQRRAVGPLFYDPRRHRGGSLGNPQSKKVGEALAHWVRELGVVDPNVAPNHGWRHRFETQMRRADVDYEARHRLIGHAFKTESGDYGVWDAKSLSREVEKLPRYVTKTGLM